MEHRNAPLNALGTRHLPDGVVLAGVVTIGLLCSALLFTSLRQTERLRVQELRTAAAEEVMDALGLDITRTVEAVHSTGLMVEVQPNLSRQQFKIYTRRIMAHLSTLSALQWLPVDPHATPTAEESRTRIIGKPVASAAHTLLGAAADDPAALAITITTPVYERYADNDSVQRHLGFVAATVPLTSLLRQASFEADQAGMSLMVYDLNPNATATHTPLYQGYGNTADLAAHTASHDQDDHGDVSFTLDMATRPWEVVLHFRPAFYRTLPASRAPYVLAASLIATLLMALVVRRAQRNRSRIEAAKLREQLARAKLHEEQSRLQRIIEGTGVASWEFNYQTRKLKLSERWAPLSGFTPEELEHNAYELWLELIHPDDLLRYQQVLKKHLAGESEHMEYEYRLKHKDGHWIWVGTRGSVIERSADGKPLLLAGTNLEISARKEAEARIRELNQTLEQRMQEALARSEARATLGTLIASVSHEMGTPMGNSLMTASTLTDQARQFQSLLESGALRRSTLTQFVEQVRDGNALLVRNLERAVALLKNFRQVAADQASEQRRQFDLQQVLQEVLGTLAPSLKRHAHTVELQADKGILMDSYPGPLGQVLINLINNAYLHAFDGVAKGTVTITAQASESHVVLTCADNGRGIAPDTLKKMFQPFFSTRIGRGGTGLGMSIVDNLVKSTLGGTLQVQSVQGQGTSVTITLPRVAPLPREDDPD